MHHGLASFAFARRYSRNRCFFLFLRLLRCFSSPGSLPYVMDWRMDDWSFSSRVSPFRYLRIDGYLLLPVAFRSLSRLSSALSAKASTLRSFLLDLFRCIALQLNLWLLQSLAIRTYKNFRFYFWFVILGCLEYFLKEYFQLSLLYEVFNVQLTFKTFALSVIRNLNLLKVLITGKTSLYMKTSKNLLSSFLIWQPPTFPYRLQYSIIGRLSLNHRVRDVDGCFP